VATYFSAKWKPAVAQKKLAKAQALLLPGEEVRYLGWYNSVKPLANAVALTNLRIAAMDLASSQVRFEALYSEVKSVSGYLGPALDRRGYLDIVCKDGESMLHKLVPEQDHDAITYYFNVGVATPPPESLRHHHERDRAARGGVPESFTSLANYGWPATTKVRGGLSRTEFSAVQRQCLPGESPWLILKSPVAGVLAAFDDRMAIIKTGGMTGLLAGALGGERAATFHYVDVTGIEYNSGLVTGVLEILTPSYNGTANRDYWRGSNRSRNADASDPFTLSNTLPLSKSNYESFLPEIKELRARIASTKKPTPPANAATPELEASLAQQLSEIAALHAAGALTDEEFTVAKARLLRR